MFVCFFQSDSSDTSGELNPVQVDTAAPLPRYKLFCCSLYRYICFGFVHFVPVCFSSLSLPNACPVHSKPAQDVIPPTRLAPASLFFLFQPTQVPLYILSATLYGTRLLYLFFSSPNDSQLSLESKGILDRARQELELCVQFSKVVVHFLLSVHFLHSVLFF